MFVISMVCYEFKIGRSICRSPLDPPRSPGGRRFRRLRPDPADRSPGPFRSRPLVSSVSVQFVSFRPFVARSSSSARSVLGSSSVRLLFRSARLVRFVFRSVHLSQVSFGSGSLVSRSFRSGLTRFGFLFRFGSVLLGFVLAPSRVPVYLYYSRVYYTLKGAKGK